MDSAKRSGAGAVTHYDHLVASFPRFHLFHALRVIEAHFADHPPLGTARRPREDPLRLGQDPSTAFPPHTITRFDPPDGAGRGQLRQQAFGLFGPHGPLPLHLTDYARDRMINQRDPTLVAFADLLTHRLAQLFYRAWTTGQPAADLDRGMGGRIERKIAALSGHAGPAFQNRDAMPDLARRHFAAFLSPGPRHPDGLRAIVSTFFDTGVAVEEFVGCWLELEPDDRWRLGSGSGLGLGTCIGERVWSRTAKFRLRLGPLSRADYDRLLPGTPALERLAAIVRNYCGLALDWDVVLVLRADQVPQTCLDGDTRLGLTSWLGARPSAADADDLHLSPPEMADRAAG
ncbi:type VI secretion system baseplate subunit TssG [Paracoccus sp. CPCC 101403]|uniref:Type VI secretion system baseplate subunit TssG n=1 Tax=Paracoccus broussonetiae TaxID=3075834 RepID=A0ABU3EDK9_9RHOB|nr:type VI secretion system baseplate subunit TssG [Paracoccus sp. CPCC 101403]MDT1062313.1 type VI secretion system baseplate subunit TssG [Paracoccus sp. CPCC 101403]